MWSRSRRGNHRMNLSISACDTLQGAPLPPSAARRARQECTRPREMVPTVGDTTVMACACLRIAPQGPTNRGAERTIFERRVLSCLLG
ncbi:hypothetical protein C8Q76DRAFT_700243 [Earliella scabrosa]|nr:hypothetical protein C8Q76DRAFT_700243 [Earliella scabrosa]